MAYAEEDEVENEEEGTVEEEPEATEEAADGEDDGAKKNVSPFAKTLLVFTKWEQDGIYRIFKSEWIKCDIL